MEMRCAASTTKSDLFTDKKSNDGTGFTIREGVPLRLKSHLGPPFGSFKANPNLYPYLAKGGESTARVKRQF